MRSITLIPFNDPWAQVQQRWLDIDDQPYSSNFAREFSYEAGQVQLSYDPAPSKPYFVGHIEARGLKPNFSYQLKLAGKPQNGSRGWGQRGDDRANEALGRATRWWNDTTQSNTDDAGFNINKKRAPEDQDTIYGYSLLGEFVTDADGKASVDFNGAYAYHIVWQHKQETHRDKLFGDFNIGSTVAPYYAYGKEVPPKKIRLWYEWEPRRSHSVKLPPGDYNCRFLVTEETFHAIDAEVGGRWPTVLASEDFNENGEPDSSSENNVVFTIR